MTARRRARSSPAKGATALQCWAWSRDAASPGPVLQPVVCRRDAAGPQRRRRAVTGLDRPRLPLRVDHTPARRRAARRRHRHDVSPGRDAQASAWADRQDGPAPSRHVSGRHHRSYLCDGGRLRGSSSTGNQDRARKRRCSDPDRPAPCVGRPSCRPTRPAHRLVWRDPQRLGAWLAHEIKMRRQGPG
jgi:hypothetical protein